MRFHEQFCCIKFSQNHWYDAMSTDDTYRLVCALYPLSFPLQVHDWLPRSSLHCLLKCKRRSLAARYVRGKAAFFYGVAAVDRLCKTCPISALMQIDRFSIFCGQTACP